MTDFRNYQNIVIKVGTSTLAHSTGMVNLRNMELLTKVIADIKNMGKHIILVSSGAIGVGFGKLGMKSRPTDIPSKQAAAAVGQCELMYLYDKYFTEYNHTVAQVLLTGDILDSAERTQNVINTFARLEEMGVIPIVNENDTVATEEIVFGDNDTLSAIVATLTKADALVILSDIDGMYTSNPKTDPDATLISDIYEINDDIISRAGGSISGLGTGGMETKVRAASITTKEGIDCFIISGTNPMGLYDLVDGKNIGTHFHSKKE
ncbi:MAG: glutamate 5-kinase [Eubacteriaceae bacterium]|nr:glutamate 5-kinase [Eubacteriaceae bacterium]